MGPLDVVLVDPARDHAEGMVSIAESVQPNALALERSEEALDHAVLLRTIGSDVLLLQAVATDDRDKRLCSKDEPVVRAQNQPVRLRYDSPVSQGLFEPCRRHLYNAGSR